MAIVYIWRKAELVRDELVIKIRDVVYTIVTKHLKMDEGEVALRIRDIGPLDRNCSIIGIEIETGPGKENWRSLAKDEIGISIADDIVKSGVIPEEWLGLWKSDVWLRIFGASTFVPLGHPEEKR
jgi:hypothetical protein